MKKLLVGLINCAIIFTAFSSCGGKGEQQETKRQDTGLSNGFAIEQRPFGRLDSQAITKYILRNPNGMTVSILNYGGTLTNCWVPDRHGSLGDVVLGFDSLAGYLQTKNPYMGALIGRYGNRISGASFSLGGNIYRLAANNGNNSLHGGLRGFDKVIWAAVPHQSDSAASLTLTYDSRDGEEGFPGNLHVVVTYSITKDNGLQLEYLATTDKPTPVNLTNHTYFNLSGGADSTNLSQVLQINADRFVAVNEELIPTGVLQAVKGSPMDFSESKKIGIDIGLVKGGYDHNYVLVKKGQGMSYAATAYDRGSGRLLEMYTTEPGVQFYSGNFLDGSLRGKKGQQYVQHAGFCLEAQHFPDSPTQPGFPDCILRPGNTYHQISVYKFSVK